LFFATASALPGASAFAMIRVSDGRRFCVNSREVRESVYEGEGFQHVHAKPL